MNGLLKRLAVASTLAALAVIGATAGSASAAQKSAVIPNCVPATNIEDIIDDSGSMSGNDSIRARAQIIQILAELKENASKTMGAVEFGSDPASGVLFPPLNIGAGLGTIQAGLNLIQADNGGTNYNAGFAAAKGQNPSANARIFLSDGEHNVGPYMNGHLDPNIKTYVVGLGSFDPTILNTIASGTGGELFVVANQTEVMKVAMRINARLNCMTEPLTREYQFGGAPPPFAVAAKKKKGPKGKSASFRPEGNTAAVLVSHGTTGSVIRPAAFRQGKRRLKGQVSFGANYQLVNLSGLKKGKVRFQVQPKKLAGPTTATVQMQP